MALPKWITPAGNLGTIPELDYYEFPLDAYDATGGTIVFSRVSGRLPLGIQVVPSGKLQGIPVSEKGGDQNVEYRFTIRATNTSSGEVSDRTFNITITNVAPPVIIPRDVDLGIFFDGSRVDLQLDAVEFTPGAALTWSLKSGELPTGLSLSSSGLISGYLEPIPEPGPGSLPGWDKTPWNLSSWNFSTKAISKVFVFTVEVDDGVNIDQSTYRLKVYPLTSMTADNDELTVDTSFVSATLSATKHTPIITTTQEELLPVRQGTYFSFNIDARDLDGDILEYSVANLQSGAFDEQDIVGNSIPYVSTVPVSGNIYAGMFPRITLTGIDLDGDGDPDYFDTVRDYTQPHLVSGDEIKVQNTSGLWVDATVNDFTTVRLSGKVLVTASPGDIITQAISGANAVITTVSDTTGTIIFAGNVITANIGDYITQPSTGANATVTSLVQGSLATTITINTGNFNLGSGNIAINGTASNTYPVSLECVTDIGCEYQNTNTFILNSAAATAYANINGANTASLPTAITSVGVAIGALSEEGTVGFSEGRFDQGALSLPSGLTIEQNTGWITGQLPSQTINQIDYEIEITVYKRDYPEYFTSRLYTLTVLGDLNNRIDWITPTDLGTIENGRISDLFVEALSTKGKPLFYKFASGSKHRLPQGLQLISSGLISGRVSFEMFSLDGETTTLDGGNLSLDTTYTFSVTAYDFDQSISADRTFTLRVVKRNVKPYEDLYLRALLSLEQRTMFSGLMTDRSIFPSESIYREEDPFFGLAKEVRTLFLPGVVASSLAEYAAAVLTNHYKKRIEFRDIKTAVALDNNFDVKYEVVYIEVGDQNTSVSGSAPENTIDLSTVIDVPYYDEFGSAFEIAYPNAFDNMRSQIVEGIGYENKGALPDWMTSKQEDGRVLGFKRAVVLAYTQPGESKKIAYRLQQSGFNFNELDFTVDRYQVDNSYSENYDTSVDRFISSQETTFDRYPKLASVFNPVANVNYAVDIPFENINKHSVATIRNELGGLDGYKNFKDGDLLIFAAQEFFQGQSDIGDYNQGWNNLQTIWDDDSWDYDSDLTDNPYGFVVAWTPNTLFKAGYIILHSVTYYRVNATFRSSSSFAVDLVNLSAFDNENTGFDTRFFDSETIINSITALAQPAGSNLTPGLGWDESSYVPGYNEHNLDPTIPNQRIGVWRININDEDIVSLTFETEVEYYNKVYVKSGFTYGGTNMYYDPVIKQGNLVPNWSIIPQQLKTSYTTFDGNGTRFYDNRDNYTVPGSNDKYIKFAKIGVFT